MTKPLSKLISSQSELEIFCQKISSQPWVVVDTEFVREHTYYPRLGLIQAASANAIACIDPVTIKDLSCFYDLLKNPSLVKVFHSAMQDLEILYHYSGHVPAPLFDTQVAAAMLGHDEQIGYASLVKTMLDVSLPKTQTRTNWVHRPLSLEQLNYASDDVYYLRDIYLQQRNMLAEKKREHWIEEDMRQLEQKTFFNESGLSLLKKLKGHARLEPHLTGLALSLAKWREQTAQQQNKPRRWILPDEIILSLCTHAPNSRDELSKLGLLTDKQISLWGKDILDTIQSNHAEPNQPAAIHLPDNHFSNEQKARIKSIRQQINKKGKEAQVAAGLLANRKDIEQLVLGNRDIRLLKGWRHELVGQYLEWEN